jgi:ribosomal protein S18 acetylase RimI-like enzyme
VTELSSKSPPSANALKLRISTTLERIPWKEKILTLLVRLFRKEKFFIFERTLDDTHLGIEAKVEVDLRLLKPEELPRIPKKFAELRIKAKDRFKKGHIGVSAVLHGELVHSKWIGFNEVFSSDMDRKLRIESDSAWVYDSYTVPEYRGIGIAPKAMEKVFEYLSAKGIRTVYVGVSQSNFQSLRAVQKEGFRKIGAITIIKVFRKKLYICEGETKEYYDKLKKMFSL